MDIANKLLKVSYSGQWPSDASKNIGIFKTDDILKVGEWMLLNTVSPSSTFVIEVVDVIDVTDTHIKYIESLSQDCNNIFTLHKNKSFSDDLKKERMRRAALAKLTKEEIELLGL